MSLEKLNFDSKQDNILKKRLLNHLNIIDAEKLTAEEINLFTSKIDEVIEYIKSMKADISTFDGLTFEFNPTHKIYVLKNELGDPITVLDLNFLMSDLQNYELKSNKKPDLTSIDPSSFPNVPAVVEGLNQTFTASKNYTDQKIVSNNGNFIPLTQKGTNNGVAELDENGKILTQHLPSYVDDVLEFESLENFPTAGESGKIYIATSTNKVYRWTGSTYTEVSQGVVLGETLSTAYRGDRGKIAYDHSQVSGNPHNTQIGQILGLTAELANKSDVGHVHNVFSTSVNGFVPAPGTSGSVRFLREDGTWVTPANTTYTAMTLPQATAGTSTTAMIIAPKVLNDWGVATFVKLVDMGDPTVGVPDWSGQLEQQVNF